MTIHQLIRFTLAFALLISSFSSGLEIAQLRAQDKAPDAATASPETAGTPPAPEQPTSTTESSPKKSDSSDKKKEKDAVAKTKVLVLPLSGEYVDHLGGASIDPTALLTGSGPAKQKSFYRLCDYFDELAKNDKVDVVVFDLSDSDLAFNLAQLDELSRRLQKLKASGKKLLAWLENATTVHVTIASQCDRVFLTDFGGVDIPSSSMQSYFYREAMDLVGIKASVVRAGNFKGAVEPYTNPVMSQHLREHYLEMLTSMNDAQVSLIAKGRGLTVDTMRQLQKARVHLPKEALAAGLIDELAPYGTMRESIEKYLAKPTEWTTYTAKPKREVSLFELMGKMMSPPPKDVNKVKSSSIAVLHLSGAIEDGKKGAAGSIVSGPTVKAIEEIIADDKIKAVVVRINSPGGSATASEAIRQALVKLVQKKPTIVSMGEMAASGGYWVSCIGVPVYAERGTITGSIGVFSLKLSFGSLLRRLGVHVENIVLDDSANTFSPDRAWTEEDEAKLQKSIDDVYSRFLSLVSESRHISVEKLQDLAGGRVWSGTQAKQNGLIDEIGGLDDCIAVVAKKANLEKFEVVHRPTPEAGLGLLDLIGAPDEDEIKLFGLSLDAIEALRHQGFELTAFRALVLDAIRKQGGQPTIWALDPADVRVR